MSIEQPKDFLDTDQLVKDPCCPFSKRVLYWHIWRAGINGLASSDISRWQENHYFALWIY